MRTLFGSGTCRRRKNRAFPAHDRESVTMTTPVSCRKIGICGHTRRPHTRRDNVRKRWKNAITGLTFSREGLSYLLEPGVRCSGPRYPSSFHRIFQQKTCKPASFKFCSFAPEIEMPAQEDCVFVSCWAFPCSFLERVWQDLHVTYGNRPAFFVFGRFHK